MKMKIGSKDIPFVYKGDKLVYPNPIKDGLLLWYDFKGMRNTDTNKEVAKDLSGNGNDGTLTNFNFTEESGYKDNTLVFDGVDDSLTIPELALDETAMTVMYDGKLYAYEDDKVLTIGEDGGVSGGGVNLFKFTDLVYPNASTVSPGTKIEFSNASYYISNILNLKADIEYFVSIDKIFNPDNPIHSNGATIQINDKTNNSAVKSLGRIFSGDILSFSLTQEQVDTQGGVFSVAIYISNSTRVSGYLEGVMVTDSINNKYSPNPQDYKTTSLSPSSITDLQLYNKTLRKDELLHNAESKGLKKLKPGVIVQDGLVLHYDFNHESNNSEYKDKAFDYSGNGNHGVLNNFNFTGESGYNENKLAFDGVDDYIETEKVPFNKSLTIESIVNLESATSYAPLLRLSPKENLSIGLIYFGVSNNFVENSPHYMLWAGTRGDSGVVQHMSIGTFIPNQIYHLSCVLDVENKTLSIYSDGQLISSLEHDIIPIEDNETTLHVGRQHSTDRIFKGKYFSAKIYNRPLTPEEIAHNYQIEKEKFNIE